MDKDFPILDSPDPDVELPIAVGLGPYGYQWANLDGDDWLYIGGYIGMTRLKYSDNGAPLQRYSMDKGRRKNNFGYLLVFLAITFVGSGSNSSLFSQLPPRC